jgi:enoyl-CoA hydratase/carnithine racemase
MSGAPVRVRQDGAVLRVTIDHPPMNVLDAAVREQLDALSRRLVADDGTRVVVIGSDDPDYFLAHADVTAVQGRRIDPLARKAGLGPFHEMVERWRTLPQATVGVVRGAARGGGLEFLLSLDMVYAARESAVFGLPEVALGILPAGGGTQRLARATSRGRALEVVLGCDDLDADEAERFGIVTRALRSDELDAFVRTLASRIASWPAPAIRLAKAAVDAALPSPVEGLADEYHYFSLLLADPRTRERLRRFLDAGGQTREGEAELGRRLSEIFPPEP